MGTRSTLSCSENGMYFLVARLSTLLFDEQQQTHVFTKLASTCPTSLASLLLSLLPSHCCSPSSWRLHC